MQNNLQKRISILFLIGAFLTVGIYLILLVQYQYKININGIAFITLLFSIFLIPGIYLLNLSEQNINQQRNLRFMWMALFVFYVLQMVYMLFFSSEFARDYVSIQTQSYQEALQTQWTYGTNLIPFHTIKSMIAIFSLPGYSNSIAYINLLGNFVAFMPFAFFLLLLFEKTKKVWRFSLFMSTVIISVEVTQFFTLTGSMDIDDYLLNFTGVMIAYGILRSSSFQRIFEFLKGNVK